MLLNIFGMHCGPVAIHRVGRGGVAAGVGLLCRLVITSANGATSGASQALRS